MRHELITVAGMTPQIVTETLWCLARQMPPVKISALHIVTTSSMRENVGRLVGPGGGLARLQDDWDIPVPRQSVHIFPARDGKPLEDIRTLEESAAFLAGITELVRRLTMEPDLALHASIAGGRKTMSFHLGNVMTLFARTQDRLTHVLVPPEFEDCREFWYPVPDSAPLGRKLIENRRGQQLDASTAKVDLTEIHHIRLRGRLSSRELASMVADPDLLIRHAQAALDSSLPESRTAFTIDAVLAQRSGAQPQQPRPLETVFDSFRSGSALTLRVSVRPDETPPVAVMLEARATGKSSADADAGIRVFAADIRHALNLERSGHRLTADTGQTPALQNPEWAVQILPDGPLLQRQAQTGLRLAGASEGLRGLRAGPPPAIRIIDLPIEDLVRAQIAADLCWTIEPIWLGTEELQLIERIRQLLDAAKLTAAGDWRAEYSAPLSEGARDMILTSLSMWAHWKTGFRASITLSADRPLPNALIAAIAAAVWPLRGFRAVNGSAGDTVEPDILNLAECFCASRPPPFDLPPIDALRSVGLPATWPTAPAAIGRTGIIVGRSNDVAIRLSTEDRARHVYALGSTGTGKSTLLRNMILQDIEAGDGVFVLDPHADLINDIAENIPERRARDVMLLDAGDTDFPFGLNFLQVDPKRRDQSGSFAVSELLAIFWRLYRYVPEAMGPAFEQYFTIAMKLLIDNNAWPKPNLLDIARLFSDSDFRDMLRKGCPNPTVQDVLQNLLAAGGDSSWENIAPYITNKINRITLNPLVRNIFCQEHSSVDFRSAMDGGKIVLVTLPKGVLPEMDVRLLGMMILGKLFGAALGRADSPESDRRPMYVYIDEFQNFVTGTVGQMMAEARKYGLRMTLANQNLAQIDAELRDTVLGNISSFLGFRVGPINAQQIEPFFAPAIDKYDLQALPNYHCASRLLSQGKPVMPPFVMTTHPPQLGESTCARLDELIELSRARYCRPRSEVEAEIEQRYRNYATAES